LLASVIYVVDKEKGETTGEPGGREVDFSGKKAGKKGGRENSLFRRGRRKEEKKRRERKGLYGRRGGRGERANLLSGSCLSGKERRRKRDSGRDRKGEGGGELQLYFFS